MRMLSEGLPGRRHLTRKHTPMITKRPALMPDRLPLGYRLRKTRRGTVLDLDLDAAGHVYDAFALAADGRRSLRAIAGMLAEAGFTRPDGKPYGPEQLRALLHEPFYAGLVRRDGKLMPAGHRGVVDAATFRYVQRQLGPDSRPEPMYR